MVGGSCLCGAVRYEVTGPLGAIHHCHCSMCRKAHGAAFSSYARAATSDVRVVEGASAVTSCRSSTPVGRTFCRTCGSNLFFRHAALPDATFVAVGSVDGDPGVRVEGHIFVTAKAPWHEITDALPQHEGYPPDA